MISIRSNITALKLLRGLDESTQALSSIYERLSSGQRINRASDDAAGLAIAESLRSDAQLYRTAARNINDGISILNIVESALSSQTSILHRLAELAEQAANGVYSSKQREALDLEYQQLLLEYGRIADTTEFNGIRLLDGSREDISIQAGITGGLNSYLNANGISSTLMSGTLGILHDLSGDGVADGTDFNILNSFGGSLEQLIAISGNSLMQFTYTDTNGEQATGYLLPVLYNYFGAAQFQVWAFGESSPGFYTKFGAPGTETIPPTGTVTVAGQFTFDLSDIDIQSLGAGDVRKTAIAFTGLETQGRAQDALDTVKNRLEDMGQLTGAIGAFQSRLSTALNLTNSLMENILQAEARIRDADIAAETAKLVSTQIRQQTIAALLAQANQQPRLVLQLLSDI